ncbi:hypothetical protein HGRIS_003986 [Hohenbuehelia grisea]|uniref:Peroxin-11C n=1 Tax=Hohenbuehelia grisea TaxID=104357 RepID=A0ABR3JH47_9AGAR
MSRPSKPVSLARLSDLTLGAFAGVPQSETIDHLIRYLGTWSGSDKLFMIIQYAVKIIVPLLELRARLQHRAGLRASPVSDAVKGYAKLGSIVGDARTLWRIWGLLPIVQWLVSLERNPQPTRRLLNIERLQGWSMLAYYPLEHLYYLCTNGIIPSTVPSLKSLVSSRAKPIKLDPNWLGLWSSRFWAAYVLLQFAHLKEDRALLLAKTRTLIKAKQRASGQSSPTVSEQKELDQRWDAFWNELVVNLGYLPLTVHWSLEKGLFGNDIWVGIFGLVAALASFRAGWRATALPSAPADSNTEPSKPSVKDVVFDAGN